MIKPGPDTYQYCTEHTHFTPDIPDPGDTEDPGSGDPDDENGDQPGENGSGDENGSGSESGNPGSILDQIGNWLFNN